MPPLTGNDLFQVIQCKTATASSLDGWGWRELKSLPVSWLRASMVGHRILLMEQLCIVGMRLFVGGGIGYVRILSFILTSGSGLTWCSLLLFLQCDPLVTLGGSGVLAAPSRIDEEF